MYGDTICSSQLSEKMTKSFSGTVLVQMSPSHIGLNFSNLITFKAEARRSPQDIQFHLNTQQCSAKSFTVCVPPTQLPYTWLNGLGHSVNISIGTVSPQKSKAVSLHISPYKVPFITQLLTILSTCPSLAFSFQLILYSASVRLVSYSGFEA